MYRAGTQSDKLTCKVSNCARLCALYNAVSFSVSMYIIERWAPCIALALIYYRYVITTCPLTLPDNVHVLYAFRYPMAQRHTRSRGLTHGLV
jgi:hypothetical protein